MAKKKYHLLYTKKDGTKVDTEVSGSSAQHVAAQHQAKADSSGVNCWPVHDPKQYR